MEVEVRVLVDVAEAVAVAVLQGEPEGAPLKERAPLAVALPPVPSGEVVPMEGEGAAEGPLRAEAEALPLSRAEGCGDRVADGLLEGSPPVREERREEEALPLAREEEEEDPDAEGLREGPPVRDELGEAPTDSLAVADSVEDDEAEALPEGAPVREAEDEAAPAVGL